MGKNEGVGGLTEAEVDVIKHSLGWPKDYRNFFGADPETDDYRTCEQLVTKGFMVRSCNQDTKFTGGIIYFHVTDAGAKAAGCVRRPVLRSTLRKDGFRPSQIHSS